jgi:hypothetical protein
VGWTKTKTVRKSVDWKPIGMRFKGRPKHGWGDEVLNDLKKLKVKNWTYLVRHKKACCELVQNTKTHKEKKKTL